MRLTGVVENMSGEVFGSGGGELLAAEMGVPLLGSVPLDPVLRESGDRGEPALLSEPDSEAARAIREIAATIAGSDTGRIVKPLPLVS